MYITYKFQTHTYVCFCVLVFFSDGFWPAKYFSIVLLIHKMSRHIPNQGKEYKNNKISYKNNCIMAHYEHFNADITQRFALQFVWTANSFLLL
jgi:hypothetical protein